MDGFEGRGHGVIHVVVTVLPVPAHTVEIVKGIQIFDHPADVVVGVKIGGICLLYLLPVGIQNVGLVLQDPHADQLADRLMNGFFLRS